MTTSYYQFSPIKALQSKAYFPLIVSNDNKSYEHSIFLKEYSESFSCTWNKPAKDQGRLNADYKYVQTNRKIDMTFVLPARNVKESLANLEFCEEIARLVYGNYVAQSGNTVYGTQRYRFEGARRDTKISFGNLIRNEPGFISKFSFTPNFDAGVFEYRKGYGPYQERHGGTAPGAGLADDDTIWIEGKEVRVPPKGSDINFPNANLDETAFVYHQRVDEVYPKEISVSISFIVVHENPLGFGGPLRPGKPLSWAENRNRDWPHGTGKDYPVPDYVKASTRPSVPARSTTSDEQGGETVIENIDGEVGLIIDEDGNARIPGL